MWSALRDEPDLTEISALRIAHNTAVCLCDLGRPAEAVEPLEQCVASFAAAGMPTERTRSRWYLAKALLGTGRRREGEALLRTAWNEFTALDQPVEAALAAFDLAEAFVVDEDVHELLREAHGKVAAVRPRGLVITP